MPKVFYLTKNPFVADLTVCICASIDWDGVDTMTLSLNKGHSVSILHFLPGDAVRETMHGRIIKMSKITSPQTLASIVLWACHAEKIARVIDNETFWKKVSAFRESHRILEPEAEFSPVWRENHRTKPKNCTEPFLFLVEEDNLLIARYAKHKGTMWITVAAYCNPEISKDEAWRLVEK